MKNKQNEAGIPENNKSKSKAFSKIKRICTPSEQISFQNLLLIRGSV